MNPVLFARVHFDTFFDLKKWRENWWHVRVFSFTIERRLFQTGLIRFLNFSIFDDTHFDASQLLHLKQDPYRGGDIYQSLVYLLFFWKVVPTRLRNKNIFFKPNFILTLINHLWVVASDKLVLIFYVSLIIRIYFILPVVPFFTLTWSTLVKEINNRTVGTVITKFERFLRLTLILFCILWSPQLIYWSHLGSCGSLSWSLTMHEVRSHRQINIEKTKITKKEAGVRPILNKPMLMLTSSLFHKVLWKESENQKSSKTKISIFIWWEI